MYLLLHLGVLVHDGFTGLQQLNNDKWQFPAQFFSACRFVKANHLPDFAEAKIFPVYPDRSIVKPGPANSS